MKYLYPLYFAFVALVCSSIGDVHAQDSCCAVEEYYDCYSCGDRGRPFFEADLLVWRGHQDGLDTVINASTTQSSSVTGISSAVSAKSNFSDFTNFEFDFRAGCRIGVGYQFCNDWIAAARWTHFHGRGGNDVSDLTLGSAGRWKLKYEVVDLTVETPYCCGPCMSWNFFGGVKIGVIDQTIQFRNSSASSSIETRPGTTETENKLSSLRANDKVEFVGAGPELGMNGVWDLGCGFSLYANAGAALVYSHISDHFDATTSTAGTTVTTGEGGGTTPLASTEGLSERFRDNVCRPVLDLAAGFCWTKDFCCYNQNCVGMFKLGWEQHRWFNHFESDRDLYVEGITFSGSLAF